MRYGGGCGNTMQDAHSIVDGFLVFARLVGSGFRVLFFQIEDPLVLGLGNIFKNKTQWF
jgi:hypothetical protein